MLYKFDFNKSGGDFTVRGGQWFHKSPSVVATPERSQNLPFFNPSPQIVLEFSSINARTLHHFEFLLHARGETCISETYKR